MPGKIPVEIAADFLRENGSCSHAGAAGITQNVIENPRGRW